MITLRKKEKKKKTKRGGSRSGRRRHWRPWERQITLWAVKEGTQQVPSGPAGDVPLTSTLSRHNCATISLIRSPHFRPCLSFRTINLIVCFFLKLQTDGCDLTLFYAFRRSPDQTRVSVAITGLQNFWRHTSKWYAGRTWAAGSTVCYSRTPSRLMKPVFATLPLLFPTLSQMYSFCTLLFFFFNIHL